MVKQTNLGNLWLDIKNSNLSNEGKVKFPAGKKPEMLIKRILDLATNEGDIVLDSFLGSGTTAAVAHKMKRRYIGIEMGKQVWTHCKKRLDDVIDGQDLGGVTSDVNWQGGGGYRFYELAPSLIELDKYGEPIISPRYNEEMLARAVAKLEGYNYSPDASLFWKQSKGSEKSYLYVCNRLVDTGFLQQIHDTMAEGEFLVIDCTAHDSNVQNMYPNIVIKKIPESLFDKTDFNIQDYKLNITNPPVNDDESDSEDE